MSDERANRGQRSSAKRQELLAIEAADWVARGELTDRADRERFEQWLKESPAHVKELLAAMAWKDTLSDDLASVRTDVDLLVSEGSNIVHIPSEAPPSATTRRFHGWRWTRGTRIAFSTAAVAAFVLVISLIVQNFWPTNVYSTSIGEQRTVALSDGSVISLNTDSRIRVDYSADARSIHLITGQALFNVSHDSERPFRVYVDGSVVQAIGTKFDVRHTPNRTSVAVIEGRVQVSSARNRRSGDDAASAQATKLAAGQGARILDGGQVTPPTPIDVAEATAWQQRRLVFVDSPLSDIINEFQRYTSTKIRIDDDHIGDLRFSGVWDADRPDILFTYLSLRANVRVTRVGDGFVLGLRNVSSATTQ